jgi:hypothetical protein
MLVEARLRPDAERVYFFPLPNAAAAPLAGAPTW